MRADEDLSEFVVVREDVVKAFDHVTRGPQDATRVDGVKEVHGDSSARYLLHLHTHGPVYTHGFRHIPLRFDFNSCPVISAENLCGGHDIPRGAGVPVSSSLDRLETTSGFLKKLYRKTSIWRQNKDLLLENG